MLQETTPPIPSSMQRSDRARAVFSTADFRILKAALGVYMKEVDEESPESVHARALYHRLGRLD